MNHRTTLALHLFPLALLVTRSFATDYTSELGGDANNAATWSPSAAGIISGTTITPLAGDRLLYSPTGQFKLTNAGATIAINAGAELITGGTVANQDNRGVQPHLMLAGTGTDGLGAFKNQGNSWVQVSRVSLTDNATVSLTGGGWRHDNHGTGFNELNLNGKTLTVTGNQGTWLVNTVINGGGVINANATAEYNFEGSSVLPADVTLNLGPGAIHSSWDGGGRNMLGNYNTSNGAIIEVRRNDVQKTYSGLINLGAGSTFFRTSASGDIPNNVAHGSHLVTGQVVGVGEFVKDGNATTNAVSALDGSTTLMNTANNNSGGTRVQAGVLIIGAQGALSPAGPLNVNAGELRIGSGITGEMTSGNIRALVTGGTLSMDGPGNKEIFAGASITSTVNLTGGVLRTAGNNTLNAVAGTINVTGNATLKPYNVAPIAAGPGLHEFHRVGADLNTDDGTVNAIYGGIKDGIPAIDSAAKPYGDNNKFVYTGQITNTTGSDMSIGFGEQYDDQIRVKVDGATVLFDTGWNTATASGNGSQPGLVNLTPGVHTIEISSFDGSGGAGPNSQWTKGVGIRVGPYTLQGPTGDQGALSQADNAAFNVISAATLPAGLTINAPAIDVGVNFGDSKNFAVSAGRAITVDTGEMYGKTYTLTGVVSGGGGLTKTGTGTLQLSGANTYSGITTVSQGVLQLGVGGSLNSASVINVAAGATFDGSAAPSVTIPATQTLSGNGSAIGNFVVVGTLSPGNSIGQLTITGNLTLSGTSAMELDRNGAPLTADNANVSGTLTYGGTLSLTNIGSPLLNGDTFNLFDAGTTTGSFSTINYPAGTTAVNWINNLGTTGSLTFIPESGTATLTLLASSLLLRRRRRA